MKDEISEQFKKLRGFIKDSEIQEAMRDYACG
jgi:hypothetical protein